MASNNFLHKMLFHGDDFNDYFKLFAAVVIKKEQQASEGRSSC
jgi:hypothetical protein